MGKLGDETESEDEGASQEHAASRPAGLAGSPRGAEKLRESEDGASPKRGRLVSGQDPSSSRTFAEVWRAHHCPIALCTLPSSACSSQPCQDLAIGACLPVFAFPLCAGMGCAGRSVSGRAEDVLK